MECPHCDLWVDTVGVCSNRNQTAQMSTAHVPFQIYDFVQLCTCTQLVCVCVCVFDHVCSFKSDFWNSLRA